jgi:glucose-6-phosphate 1-dehydrogenase
VIALGMRAKLPGESMEGEDVELIAKHQSPSEMTPYERLLGDAMRGDQSLFASEQSIEAQWRIVQPVLGNSTPLYEYDQNTWGPAEASRIIEKEEGWLNPA